MGFRLWALGSRLLLAFTVLASPAAAQDSLPNRPQPVDTAGRVNLFLDCRATGCDFNYLRTQLTWVNYVRDRTAAQVYVIATSLGTGSGGSRVTLEFTGAAQFTGVDDTVNYVTPQGASGDEQRQELARVLKVGLARYVLRTRFGRNLMVSYLASRDGAPDPRLKDPWNYWVFSIGFSGALNGESQSSSRSGNGSVYASRTTAAWKFRANVSGNTSVSRYHLDDTTEYVARVHSYSGGGLLVRSINDHLSLGGAGSVNSSSQQNIDFGLRVAPTLEYDFFKYDQYARRRLVASYSVGFDDYSYTDTTIFNRIKETRLDNQVSLSYAATQPWGSASAAISGSNYLSNFSQNRLSLYTSLSLRVARGLQVSYALSYSRVRDQLSLAAAAASDAEILLRLRQLATSYTYGGWLSVSYTFGSLFNNVVNPRMGY
ncbi:MAG: hypothetical protein ACRELE_07475 [Gemmatimonadales bacterium]